MAEIEKDMEQVRTATAEALSALIYHPAPQVLLVLLDNPALDESQLLLLLARKDLPAEILEEIGKRKALLKNYATKKALLFHPRVPRLIGLRLLKDLYLMDLVQFALSPGVSPELKRYAEEQLVARLPQLPLGQKITLARRGPGRVAGALITEGHAQVAPVALDNPFLTEAHWRERKFRLRLCKPSRITANGRNFTTCDWPSCAIYLPHFPLCSAISRNSPCRTCGNSPHPALCRRIFASISRRKFIAGWWHQKDRRAN